MHARKSRDQWRAIIRAFKQSGETHVAFCTKRGLNVGSFRGWLYRLGREGTSDVRLVPVNVFDRGVPVDTEIVAPARVHAPRSIVVVVGDVELRVSQDSDPAYVAALVRELARC